MRRAGKEANLITDDSGAGGGASDKKCCSYCSWEFHLARVDQACERFLQVGPPPAEPGAGYSKLKALQTKALPQSPEIASAHKLKHLLPGRSRGAPALNPSGSAEEVSVFSTTRMAHGMRQQTRAGKKMSSAHR